MSTIATRVQGQADRPATNGRAPNLARELTALLSDVRQRTLALIAPLSEEDLQVQHDPLMSPIVWDLGHIAGFEELWLLHHVDRPFDGLGAIGEMPGLFNPFEHPRGERGQLALPSIAECLNVLTDIRERVLQRLSGLDLDNANPLTREGYAYRMVAQHEAQHGETILQTLQLKRGTPYPTPLRAPPPSRAGGQTAAPAVPLTTMVRFLGGSVSLGTDDRREAYDNERPRYRLRLAPFEIDVTPVTNAAYLDFMEDGGYSRAELWSSDGCRWLLTERAMAPAYWYRNEDAWWTRTMDRPGPVDPTHPVVHVCYHEAQAFARWAGKRLPTEAEWEAAATWDPATGVGRPYPWGEDAPSPALANIDQVSFGTAPVGAYSRNVSPIGCRGMIGDVWEWTSSDFGPYPGFASFPYREYSEVFFGPDYKVLRGGSWATRSIVARPTFRNWDYPIRRQIFSGFRCVRDV